MQTPPMCQLQAMPLSVPSRFPLYLEPVACHTTLVLLYCALAVFLRIVALREQHAVVSACFLVFADTARLSMCVSWESGWRPSWCSDRP